MTFWISKDTPASWALIALCSAPWYCSTRLNSPQEEIKTKYRDAFNEKSKFLKKCYDKYYDPDGLLKPDVEEELNKQQSTGHPSNI